MTDITSLANNHRAYAAKLEAFAAKREELAVEQAKLDALTSRTRARVPGIDGKARLVELLSSWPTPIRQLADALAQEGLFAGVPSVQSTLTTLKNRGLVEKVSRGVWRSAKVKAK